MNHYTTNDSVLAEYIQSRLNIEPVEIVENLFVFKQTSDLYDIITEYENEINRNTNTEI